MTSYKIIFVRGLCGRRGIDKRRKWDWERWLFVGRAKPVKLDLILSNFMLIIKIYQYCPGIVTSSLTSKTVPFHFTTFALWYNLISYRLAHFCRGNSIIIQLNMRITSGIISNGANLATLSAYHMNNIRHYRFNLQNCHISFAKSETGRGVGHIMSGILRTVWMNITCPSSERIIFWNDEENWHRS